MNRILYELGVDTSNVGGARGLAKDNLRALPYITRIYARQVKGKPPVRVPCLTDPNYREGERKKLKERAKEAAGYGVTGYTLGDENFLARSGQDVCFSPTCKEDFRRYLREVYGDLEHLNREWGTNYSSWEEVEPITLEEARKSGRFAQWADHRMHMESVFANIHGLFAKFIGEEDPGARVGLDGVVGFNSYQGIDWWKFSRIVDVWNVYPDPVAIEVTRSFKRPGTYSGFWYGGYIRPKPGQRCEEYERWAPWYGVFHELNASWWFKIYSVSMEICQEDAIASDLRVMPVFRWTAEEIGELKRGVAKLLLGCKRENFGIAILYSQASIHASTIDPGGGTHHSAQRKTLDLLEDLGLQYDFISYAQVEEGWLERGGYKLLILPYSQALSEGERRQIERFVKGGGTVIADLRPGVMDGHCKRVVDEGWQRLLGASLDPKGKIEEGGATIRGRLGGRDIRLSFESVLVDRGVKAKGAKVMGKSGKTPVLLVNPFGRGKFVLLNMAVVGYERDGPEGEKWRELFSSLLSSSEIEPWAKITPRPGPLFHGEVVTYSDGKLRYLALLKDPFSPTDRQEIEVELPGRFHVYNVRSGRYLGNVRRFATSLRSGRAGLFALLPYKVKGIKAIVHGPAKPGRVVRVSISLATEGGKPGRHVARMEVIGPEGRERRYYAQNVNLKQGRGEVEIPLALNDPAGEWRVKVRDVASGVEGETKFSVGD